jgi:spore coat protein H
MNKLIFLITIILIGFTLSCKINDTTPANSNPDWTTATHSNDGTPDYNVVFPQDKVNTLELTIRKTAWDSLKTNMKTIYSGAEFGQYNDLSQVPMETLLKWGLLDGGLKVVDQNAMYLNVKMTYNGKVWNNIGYRVKGNGSLLVGWITGNYKLPFHLKMDKFEDKFPAIKDQRFYGFKDLTFAPGFGDRSLIRDKVANDIFIEAGVNAPKTAFYKLYIDFGEGKKYCGVYTCVESIDDSMVKTQFGESKGNIYKPESYFERYDNTQMFKKNNEVAGDFEDVKAFITALNAPIRKTNVPLWKTNLENTFNVDHFLKWLAVTNVILSTDAYGTAPHNHYLYNSPTKKLTWIPWDQNDALKNTDYDGIPPDMGGGGPPMGGGGQPPADRDELTIPLEKVTAKFPLIRYLADDPIYFAKYKQYVKDFTNNVFTTAKMNALFEKNTNLIAPFVNGTEKEVYPYSQMKNSSEFTQGLPYLKDIVIKQNQAVKEFLK